MSDKQYRICTRCIMDTTDPDIAFDDKGVCNHCRAYEKTASQTLYSPEEGQRKLKQVVEGIKARGRRLNLEHACLMGLSGGTDSSYVAYLAKQHGLNPLVIHLDNEWDDPIAIRNVKNIVEKLGFEKLEVRVDWEEFKDMQLAFMKASVVDIEMLTDHAIAAVLYKIAAERNIKHMLTGTNTATEAIRASNWSHDKNDLKNIKAIYKRFGTRAMRSFPTLGMRKKIYYKYVKGIQIVPMLNYAGYVKQEAQETLSREVSWQDYGGKHYESIFTRFYQAYILPTKFGVDKRKGHYSSLICSGQMTRDEALAEMEKEIYPADMMEKDKKFVLEKLGLTNEDFEEIMSLPIRRHEDFPSSARIGGILRSIRSVFRNIKGRR